MFIVIKVALQEMTGVKIRQPLSPLRPNEEQPHRSSAPRHPGPVMKQVCAFIMPQRSIINKICMWEIVQTQWLWKAVMQPFAKIYLLL